MKIELSQLINLFHIRNTDLKTGIVNLWRDTKLRALLFVSLFLNIIAWLVGFFINTRVTEKFIALHHNVYFGITLIGTPRQVYFIPFLGLIIIMVNIVFSYLIKEEDNFFVYVLIISSLLINIFLLLGLGAIMLINFR